MGRNKYYTNRGRRDRGGFGDSLRKNDVTFNRYVDRLTELSISMFDWQNLPPTIDPRYMELSLFSDGKVVFFRDEVIGELCLRCTISSPLSVYGIPLRRRAFSVNGYQKDLTDKDSVLIYNNMLHSNSTTDVLMYAERLYNLDRIIDINANAQKTPLLLQGSETQRLVLLNLYKEYDGNAPVIFGDKNLDLNSLKVLTTDAPYVADKIYQLKTQIWNEALTYLGISNINIQKKERLISDEVMRNQGGVIASRYSRLESRREACEAINDMFGLNVKCDFREDFREADDEVMLEGDTGDKDEMTDMVVDLRTN